LSANNLGIAFIYLFKLIQIKQENNF